MCAPTFVCACTHVHSSSIRVIRSPCKMTNILLCNIEFHRINWPSFWSNIDHSVYGILLFCSVIWYEVDSVIWPTIIRPVIIAWVKSWWLTSSLMGRLSRETNNLLAPIDDCNEYRTYLSHRASQHWLKYYISATNRNQHMSLFSPW